MAIGYLGELVDCVHFQRPSEYKFLGRIRDQLRKRHVFIFALGL